jgi:1-aminocyclopropane-1-carboxylate deaminase/D-cysteine desulfhydrase-like pyridoxal-dependent ACC family enzyme
VAFDATTDPDGGRRLALSIWSTSAGGGAALVANLVADQVADPVYAGKSMHGMIDKVRRGEFPAGSRVLYLHLGGVPALNADGLLLRNG